jgi:putative transferase (TIGR04331 family)
VKKILLLSKYDKLYGKDLDFLFLDYWYLFGNLPTVISDAKHNIYPDIFYKKKIRIRHLNKCEKIYRSILRDIVFSLNKIHNINFSKRSWEVLLGHWLRTFIIICYCRFLKIEDVLKNYKIKKIYIKKINNLNLSVNASEDIYDTSANDEWNSELNIRILKFLNNKYPLVYFKDQKKIYFKNKKNLLNQIINFFFIILSKFDFLYKRNSAFIYQTYLPRFYEIILEMKFFQFPNIYRPRIYLYKKYNSVLRKKINFTSKHKRSSVERFIRTQLSDAIPIFAIESFNDISDISLKSPLPKKPKFIFTSNAFASDEVIKNYIARQLNFKNTFYYTGQHGDGYFVNINRKYMTEIDTSDKFLSWGEKNNKSIPVFNFCVLNRNIKSNLLGHLLIVAGIPSARTFLFDEIKNNLRNCESISSIGSKLPNYIQKKTLIRLNKAHYFKNKINDSSYYDLFFKNLKIYIDRGEKSIWKLLKSSRIALFNTNSTGLLNNLALNLPSIFYCDDLFNEIDEKYIKYYNYLYEANILFKNQDKLVEHLEKYWDNIDLWWKSEFVQKNINQFNRKINIRPNEEENLNKLYKILKK